MNLFN